MRLFEWEWPPRGPYIQKLGLQLVYLCGKNLDVRPCWRRGVIMGRLEDSKVCAISSVSLQCVLGAQLETLSYCASIMPACLLLCSLPYWSWKLTFWNSELSNQTFAFFFFFLMSCLVIVFHHSSGKVNKAVSTHYMAWAFPEDKWKRVLSFTTLQCYYISDLSVPLCYTYFILPQSVKLLAN